MSRLEDWPAEADLKVPHGLSQLLRELLAVATVVHSVVAGPAEGYDPISEVNFWVDVMGLEVRIAAIVKPTGSLLAQLALAAVVNRASQNVFGERWAGDTLVSVGRCATRAHARRAVAMRGNQCPELGLATNPDWHDLWVWKGTGQCGGVAAKHREADVVTELVVVAIADAFGDGGDRVLAEAEPVWPASLDPVENSHRPTSEVSLLESAVTTGEGHRTLCAFAHVDELVRLADPLVDISGLEGVPEDAVLAAYDSDALLTVAGLEPSLDALLV